MTTSELRSGDLDRMAAVVEDAYADDPTDALPWALLEGLARLVPCDVEVNYQRHDLRACATPCIQSVEPGDVRLPAEAIAPDPADPFWQNWWTSMCSWPQRSGDLRRVVHTGDFFPTERQRLADPMREVLPDIAAAMIVSLPAPPGEARRVVFFRGTSPGFTERDRQVATLLRPHLQEIWLDAERRRAAVPRLSPREWELLALAAAGRSNADIAAQLFISVGTVRKHMEHIRERVGVHSIAAAAAVAMPHAPAHLRVRSTAAARGPSSPGDAR
jgi:DNA-binding CsgD family transcriptional regulator